MISEKTNKIHTLNNKESALSTYLTKIPSDSYAILKDIVFVTKDYSYILFPLIPICCFEISVSYFRIENTPLCLHILEVGY